MPDALSRHIGTLTMEGQVTRPEVKAEQELDKFCRKVKEDLDSRREYIIDKDGLLYRKD